MPSSPLIEVPTNTWVWRLTAWVCALTAFSLSVVTLKSCKFFERELVYNFDELGTEFWGLFRFTATANYCSSIDLILESIEDTDLEDEFELDWFWKGARYAGIVAAVLGGIVVVILSFQLFSSINKCTWRFAGFLELVCCLVTGGTFVVLLNELCDSDDDEFFTILYGPGDSSGYSHRLLKDGVSVKCSLDEGASTAIAGMIIYLAACILICRTPPPDAPMLKFVKPRNIPVAAAPTTTAYKPYTGVAPTAGHQVKTKRTHHGKHAAKHRVNGPNAESIPSSREHVPIPEYAESLEQPTMYHQ